MTSRVFHGIPREKIPWSPTVDPEICISCKECLHVCANGVFEFSDVTSKVVVSDPMNCVVLCDHCAQLCPAGAISFPDKNATQKILVELFHSRRTDKKPDTAHLLEL